jgi:hypothetical protein
MIFFTKTNTELDNKILEEIAKVGKFYKSKINGYAKSIISREITDLKKRPLSAGITKIQIPAGFEPMVDNLIDGRFGSNRPTEATKKLLRSYAAYLLSKQVFSSFRTGLVFAGFGTDELCPSLEAIEIDGIINNRLKYVETKSIDIGRKGPVADILGFAQDDMVHTFLDGVDPAFRKYVKGLVAEIIDDTSQTLLGAVTPDPAEATKIKTSVQPVFDKMKDDFIKKADDYIEKSFTSRIKEMIRSMPKQEMSLLAESMIEITSLKRKVTREQETVGGEVDVAIITKSEGFVWTKRKHYFPPELNKRFFVRHFKNS